MTRGGQVLSEKMATRMDGVKSGYSAKTADPCTALLRSSGRDDKERASTFREGGDVFPAEGHKATESCYLHSRQHRSNHRHRGNPRSLGAQDPRTQTHRLPAF